jgi:hypothetical protein
MEAKGLPRLAVEAEPVSTSLCQHRVSADEIGLDECTRTVDGAVDVALGGKVSDDLGPEFTDRRAHCMGVADVARNKPVTMAARHPLYRRQSSRVG